MIGKKSGAPTLMFGKAFGALAYKLSPQFHPIVRYLVIGVFVIAFYCAVAWAFNPIEFNQKLPTPSRELCRRNKEFYASLGSQRRRQNSATANRDMPSGLS